ncbi:MAG TPA: DUF2958 domain-containing protein [Anaerolineae bacterium]|nr:DUF2958 domain-containing protein [Anaerolineae bacterium]
MKEGELQPPIKGNLLNKESQEKLPELYSGEELGLDALAQVKFFTPDSNWTWYASEFDGKDLFFGLVIGFDIEIGYFSLSEMQAVRGPWGLPIERDLYFEPTILKELMEEHMQKRRELNIEQAKRYAAELAQWDQRIIEIVAVGSLADNKKLDLVCTFDPEPAGDATGFFWVTNLLARDEYEQLSQRIGLEHSVDLGFRIGEDIHLPGGEIVRESGEQTRLWPL